MAGENSDSGFFIWERNRSAQGPIELPALIAAIKKGSVTADTWLFAQNTGVWCKASEAAELKMFFKKAGPKPATGGTTEAGTSVTGIKPGSLRRVKIFADMSDEQLDRFAQMMEIERVPNFKLIAQQGSSGDAMFCVLEGEVRARIMVSGKETTLATLSPGDVVGEFSLFDDGPRSADVIANSDVVLLKISAANFDRLVASQPDLAAPFLLALGRTLVSRVRKDNKRIGEFMTFARGAQ